MYRKTVSEVIDRTINVCSLNGRVGPGLRHERTWVVAEANVVFRELRDLVSARGWDGYLEQSDPAPLPAKDTEFPIIRIPWVTTWASVHGVEVSTGGPDEWHRLTKGKFRQRYNGGSSAREFSPTRYAAQRMPKPLPDGSLEAGVIELTPVYATVSGRYIVHFVPEWTDAPDTGQGIFYYSSAVWETYHVASLGLRLLGARDGDMKKRVDAITKMRDDALVLIPDITALADADTDLTIERGSDYWG